MKIPANGFTHAGKFHADDVFATALLQILRPDITFQVGILLAPRLCSHAEHAGILIMYATISPHNIGIKTDVVREITALTDEKCSSIS